jgi:hypothetical protein
MVIKHVGVWSAARISGALYAVMGLLVGLMFAAFASLGVGLASEDSGAFIGMLFGIGGIVIAPILYGVLGLIGGAIGAAIYNLVAGAVGGIEIDAQ